MPYDVPALWHFGVYERSGAVISTWRSDPSMYAFVGSPIGWLGMAFPAALYLDGPPSTMVELPIWPRAGERSEHKSERKE